MSRSAVLLTLGFLTISILFLAFGQYVDLESGTGPKCPVCKRKADWPGQALVLADSDGVFRGATFGRVRVFVCSTDGAIFGAAWNGP